MSFTDPRVDIRGDVVREAFVFVSFWGKRYQIQNKERGALGELMLTCTGRSIIRPEEKETMKKKLNLCIWIIALGTEKTDIMEKSLTSSCTVQL